MYRSHIFLLYYYGLRIGEVFDERIFFDDNNNRLIIFAQKRNKARILKNTVNYTKEHVTEVLNNNQITYFNYKSLQREIKKLMPYRNIQSGNKAIGAHIFRHNYIKQLREKGYTETQIKDDLGYINCDTVKHYLDSSITI